MKTHWQYGKNSGYPICCILWFYLRQFLINLTGLERWYGFTKRFAVKKAKHIPCIFHQVVYRLFPKKLKYSTCGYCGWVQLGKGSCRVKSLHKTIMVKDNKEFIKRLKKHGVNVNKVKLPGKLIKKLVKESK